MHFQEAQWTVERILAGIAQEYFPLDWKEDSITHRLMIELRNHFGSNTTISGFRGREVPMHLEWEVYKLHGRRETAYGDIGLLVRQRMADGSVVEGAAFLEAKVRGRDTTKFLQVRHDQVARLLASSAQARLLLYDYNPVAVLDEQEELPPWFWKGGHPLHPPYRINGLRTTHGPVMPLALAAAVNQYDDSLYQYCHSFSYQLCRRYFALHDLEFAAPAVNAVKGFPGDIGAPRYVMVLQLTPAGQEPPEKFRPNDNLYGALE